MTDYWNICPVCGSRNVVADCTDEFDGTLMQSCRCEDCGTWFENIYSYTEQVVVDYTSEEE